MRCSQTPARRRPGLDDGKVFKTARKQITNKQEESKTSVKFVSKAAGFHTAGATGLAVSCLFSMPFASGFVGPRYLHASLIGVLASTNTCFLFNRYWTFGDGGFGPRNTFSQHGRLPLSSSAGALVRMGTACLLVESYAIGYTVALVPAVISAAFGSLVLSKKPAFEEKAGLGLD